MGDYTVFSDYVYYSTTSKTGLRWKIDRVGGFNNSVLIAKKDAVAGSKTKSGHYEVSIVCQSYYCHRIIWELFGNEMKKGYVVDHKDGNGLNNNILNLRLVKHRINIRNSSMNKNNTSGTKGVCRITRKDAGGNITFAWKASWWDLDGKGHSASFSEIKFGSENAKKLAIETRVAEIEKLNEQGAEYSERHIYGD